MGRGFRQGGWNFDCLVRAVRQAGGGGYRLLGVAERVRVLSILACLPARLAQAQPGIGHYNFNHAPSQGCELCRAEAISISICDLRARTTQGGIRNAG